MTTPPYLKKGDTIAITCPAGFMAKEKVAICVETLKKEGYKVVVGKTVGSKSKNYFSGTDAERLDEIADGFAGVLAPVRDGVDPRRDGERARRGQKRQGVVIHRHPGRARQDDRAVIALRASRL